jgi:hypothetical protein
MNFLQFCKVSAIIEFEIKTKITKATRVNLPTLSLTGGSVARSAATSPLTEVKIDEVAREAHRRPQGRTAATLEGSRGCSRMLVRTRALC